MNRLICTHHFFKTSDEYANSPASLFAFMRIKSMAYIIDILYKTFGDNMVFHAVPNFFLLPSASRQPIERKESEREKAGLKVSEIGIML
ncbi:MAG: hypothetical protein ACTTKN_08270 [Phocaeicola sp.]|uniref:hypothetical protein n=1 Tax=Phocaeicola sp. TaxID=2773926 RepID=UPI003F9EF2C8